MRLRVSSYRLLIGHSLGGLYAVYALLYHPNLFNAVVAFSPFLVWDSNTILEEARVYAQGNPTHRLLFIADEKIPEEKERSTLDLIEILSGADRLESEFRRYIDAGHMSLIVKALPDALDYMFPGFVQDR
jgi:predicted alpha/beta superfamily hydrolase